MSFTYTELTFQKIHKGVTSLEDSTCKENRCVISCYNQLTNVVLYNISEIPIYKYSSLLWNIPLQNLVTKSCLDQGYIYSIFQTYWTNIIVLSRNVTNIAQKYWIGIGLDLTYFLIRSTNLYILCCKYVVYVAQVLHVNRIHKLP